MNAAAKENYTRKDLDLYIKEIFGVAAITPLINKQINRFVLNSGMTFKQIARSICWYIEVDKNEIGPSSVKYGIWFVPNVFEFAEKYFNDLAAEKLRQEREAIKMVQYDKNKIIFNAIGLKHERKLPPLIDIAAINIEDKGE